MRINDDILAILSSGYIGSNAEAVELRQEWMALASIYENHGLGFVVAPRCDDPDMVSRKGLWEYSAIYRDWITEQSRDKRLILIGFSAGGPIMDMGIFRSKGYKGKKPKILATFYIEATHSGIPIDLVRSFGWPLDPFMQDLDPDSRFMRELTKSRPKNIKNCFEISGKFSKRFPGVFGPLDNPSIFFDINHGKLEYSGKVHLEIINKIHEIL